MSKLISLLLEFLSLTDLGYLCFDQQCHSQTWKKDLRLKSSLDVTIFTAHQFLQIISFFQLNPQKQ